MNRSSLGRSVSVSLAVLLLVAACSGSITASSAPASAPPNQPAGASLDPVMSGEPGDSTDAGTGDGTDYCSLFTLDQIAAVVGQPVQLGDQSMLFGTGCRWDTADGRGGVVVSVSPVHLGFGDIATQSGQQPLAGVGDQATIGPGIFDDAAGDIHTGTLAAALVGEGYAAVTVAPRPSDDVVIGLLKDLIAKTR